MEVDQQLATNIKAAKTKRMYFAFVSKGTDGALLVSKTKVPPAQIAEAKAKSGGTQVFKGACMGEDGKLVFELAKEPPATMEAALKKVIKRDAGITQACICRLGTDADLADGDAAEQPDAASAIPKAPPPPPEPSAAKQAASEPDGLGAAFKRKEAAILPLMKTALAKADDAARHFAAEFKAAQTLANEKQFHAASAKLNALSAGLQTAASEKPAEKPAADDAATATQYKVRLTKAMASIKETNVEWLKSNIEQFKTAEAHLKALAFAKYAPLVETLEKIAAKFLSNKPAAPAAASSAAPVAKSAAPETGNGKLSLVKLGKARIEWGSVLRQSVLGIKRLKGALKMEFGADAEQKSQLDSAMQKLDGLVGDFNEELGDELDKVLNASEDQRPAAVASARAAINKFTQKIDGNPLVPLLDGNSLVPDTQVAGPMKAKLREIAAALG